MGDREDQSSCIPAWLGLGRQTEKHVMVTDTSVLDCELCKCQQKALGRLCPYAKAFLLLPQASPARALTSTDRCWMPAGQGKVELPPLPQEAASVGAGVLWWAQTRCLCCPQALMWVWCSWTASSLLTAFPKQGFGEVKVVSPAWWVHAPGLCCQRSKWGVILVGCSSLGRCLFPSFGP